MAFRFYVRTFLRWTNVEFNELNPIFIPKDFVYKSNLTFAQDPKIPAIVLGR